MPDPPREPTLAAPVEHGLLSAGEVFLKKYRTEIAASASSCVSTFIAVSESASKTSRIRGIGEYKKCKAKKIPNSFPWIL